MQHGDDCACVYDDGLGLHRRERQRQTSGARALLLRQRLREVMRTHALLQHGRHALQVRGAVPAVHARSETRDPEEKP